MCGRYATTANPARLAVELDALDETTDGASESGTAAKAPSGAGAESGANYNVAPTNRVLTVVRRHDRDHPDDDPALRIRRMRWGLIPVWTKAAEPGVPAKGKPLFNARADRATAAPSFRDSAKKRRCLVPMDGWYEWLAEPDPTAAGKTVKQPYYMSDADGGRLYMAGLWSVWRDPAQREMNPLLSCTILTTDAVGDLTRIHHRMPLMMPREHWDAWLDPDHPAPGELLETPSPQLVSSIVARPVNPLVNSVRNNGPQLLEPVDSSGDAGQISLI
ncbi:SOS response-associated peptidase [Nocardia vermiculata]|uniref:Abasic site processing protein n=1 Tax=Nocardia vermiculata TaxID=257274 RepID=A0A846Y2F2_9NOCA|nr:SOS response-associated peptidase [Nocardia vermiculata]NKY53017.1 SOS response-associated peptidase [Nocardia vermiculata]